jgi:cytochrome P450
MCDEQDVFEIIYSKLPYTKAVASEVLRLHPSVPKDIKFAVNDDVLPDGSPVRAGQGVFYCPYAMGRNPTIWKEPLKVGWVQVLWEELLF